MKTCRMKTPHWRNLEVVFFGYFIKATSHNDTSITDLVVSSLGQSP